MDVEEMADAIRSASTNAQPVDNTPDLYPVSALAALALAAHGYRRGSLSRSGAVAAALVGYATLACPLRAFGAMLLTFYLVGSRATRIKADVKASREAEYHVAAKTLARRLAKQANKSAAGTKGKQGPDAEEDNDDGDYPQAGSHVAHSGGKRTASQVLCNGFMGALCAMLFRFYFHEDESSRGPQVEKRRASLMAALQSSGLMEQSGWLPRPRSWQGGWAWCSLEPMVHRGLPATFAMLALGHFACCMGDTLASEVGILSPGRPFLITMPWRRVPHGTNGGVSPLGLIASALGGAIISLALLVCVYVTNPACINIDGLDWSSVMTLGTGAGLVGSLLDSILGATLQRTWYNERTGQVLVGPLPRKPPAVDDEDEDETDAGGAGSAKNGSAEGVSKASEREAQKIAASTHASWKVVTGLNVLSNNQVNLFSSMVTAVGTVFVGFFFLL